MGFQDSTKSAHATEILYKLPGRNLITETVLEVYIQNKTK